MIKMMKKMRVVESKKMKMMSRRKISFSTLLILVFLVIVGVMKKAVEAGKTRSANGLLFAVLITGVLTDAIKDDVGRPRPDFFWRCFPDGEGVFDTVTKNFLCTGDKKVIKEGHKSFPSGHTSWSFAGLGYLAWYLAGKVRVFDRMGHVAKLCLLFLPLLVASLVGVSRVDDYWHYWQDVFAGGLSAGPISFHAGKQILAAVPGEVLLDSFSTFSKGIDAAEVAEKQALSTSSKTSTKLVSDRHLQKKCSCLILKKAAEANKENISALMVCLATEYIHDVCNTQNLYSLRT
ncbi:hypothetical protein C5167_004637 [Papaver somniferum]|uniref:Phosphatidic acid phosphatase type 2/haloperoxidase domain-containing protein n=1 Tax=Papaver somniferum TaxID=3469 RepID=A0A4Y7J864_PAPSO|nr:hypothetical protein C5167_004637 [Papaver somniferum]